MTQAAEGINSAAEANPLDDPSQNDGRRRVIIEGVSPEVDAGRFPAKRTVGDLVEVTADVFTDGHDAISAVLRYRKEGANEWLERPMTALVNDRWVGQFPVDELGRYRYTIEAWVDHWETWLRDLRKRIQAESDTPLDYLIGAGLIEETGARAGEADRARLRKRALLLRTEESLPLRRTAALEDAFNEIMRRYPDRRFATAFERELVIVVDPVRARFSSWYELFPDRLLQKRAAMEPSPIVKRVFPTSRRWVSTLFIFRLFIQLARNSAKAKTTPWSPSRAMSAARGRSEPLRADTSQSWPSLAPSLTLSDS